MLYQIGVNITIKADSEEEAKNSIRDFLTTADSFLEISPIKDFSIEEVQESYPEPTPRVNSVSDECINEGVTQQFFKRIRTIERLVKSGLSHEKARKIVDED